MQKSAVITKPPRPPCWRDFVCDSSETNPLKKLYFSDLNKIQKPEIQFITSVGDGFPYVASCHLSPELSSSHHISSARSGKHGKRPRAKLHRTRSQMLIQEEDLPNGSLTMNLSETKPREFGLDVERRHVCDNRRYLEENTKRCQNWLATVEASLPLDDIAFTQGSGVDIEIPEECWDSRTDLRPPNNSSASSSDNEGPLPKVTPLATKDVLQIESAGECKRSTIRDGEVAILSMEYSGTHYASGNIPDVAKMSNLHWDTDGCSTTV